MPFNAIGWTTEEDGKLIDLVKPHPEVYDPYNPSRRNIVAQEFAWQEIANKIAKPADECKKRWKTLRYGFMRIERLGTFVHRNKVVIHEKLQFLKKLGNQSTLSDAVLDPNDILEVAMVDGESSTQGTAGGEKVITDNQEYYEIELVDEASQVQPIPDGPIVKLLPASQIKAEPTPNKIVKRNVGRKKSVPIPPNLTPVKILPKPLINMREPRLVRCIETPKTLEQRSQTVDKLVEKLLRESTNEIDVFFRSMAASVKKLQPNLIPKVKMEVCNVIAKYEMQSFDKTS